MLPSSTRQRSPNSSVPPPHTFAFVSAPIDTTHPHTHTPLPAACEIIDLGPVEEPLSPRASRATSRCKSSSRPPGPRTLARMFAFLSAPVDTRARTHKRTHKSRNATTPPSYRYLLSFFCAVSVTALRRATVSPTRTYGPSQTVRATAFFISSWQSLSQYIMMCCTWQARASRPLFLRVGLVFCVDICTGYLAPKINRTFCQKKMVTTTSYYTTLYKPVGI